MANNVSAARKVYSTGRRKTAAARVWLVPGTGKVTVNKRGLHEYFKRPSSEMIVKQPLVLTASDAKLDVSVTVRGSGLNSQAGAVRHGIARALVRLNPEFRRVLKRSGLLTRDSRVKERKKYGQKGARKRFQFSKR